MNIENKKKKINSLLLCLGYACHMHAYHIHEYHKGVVLKPVINVVGQPILKDYTYDQFPYAGASNPFQACPRLHQLLYNETVEIIKQEGNELYIKIPHAFYITAQNKVPQCHFWTHKDTIVPLSSLDEQQQNCIVRPLSYETPNQQSDMVVTLAYPWYCKTCSTTFSAGTRFVCRPHKKGARSINVYALHPKTHKPLSFNIPRNYCVINNDDKKQIKTCYVQLLKDWAHTPGIIPYVWGGCSLIAPLTEKATFFEVPATQQNSTAYIYDKANSLINGFDCAGLILRAAQAAGMPYFYKNTTTLATYLKPITDIKDLTEGDLIWIPWHVMAVANLERNTLIEARHYNHGFGKVHEIELNKVFKDIHSYADLYHAIKNHKALYRLDKAGKAVETIKQAKLLSIESCWHQHH